MAVTKQQVAELYVATFNRAPDADGLDYWVNLSGLSIDNIAKSFFDQAETQTLYPSGTTNSAFVTSIYQNLFNRAPDAPGLAYWVANLDNGTMTRDVMILAMKNGALADTNTNLVDKAIILNKAEVALYYADTLGLQGTDYTLEDVTEYSSSVTAAKAEVDNISDNGGDTGATGTTYTLTTGIDTIAGTDANDTINATDTTVTALDTISGGNGTDVMNLVDLAGATNIGSVGGLTVSGVETINLRSAGAADITTTAFTGLTEVNITQGTTSSVTAATTTAVSIAGISGAATVAGGSTQTVTSVGGATLSGATGAIDAAVTSVGTGAGAVTINGGTSVTLNATEGTVVAGDSDAGAEVVVGTTTNPSGAIVVNYTGGGYVDGANDTMNNIAIAGGSTVTVTTTAGITAAQTTTALTDATNFTITQGAVAVTGGSATTAVTVNQQYQAEADYVANTTTGVIGVAAGAVTIADKNAGTANANTIATVSLTNADAATIDSNALSTLNLAGKLVTVNATNSSTATTPAVTTVALNLTGATSTGAVTIDPEVTTLNIASSTTSSTLNSLVTSATTINVSGNAVLTLTGNTLNGAAETITVTNTAGVTFGTAFDTDVTFAGGAGADTISLGATTKAITMGAGNDTVTVGASAITGTVDAGSGDADTLIMSDANATTASANSTFETKISGFERLSLTGTTAANQTVYLDNLDNINYVSVAGVNLGNTLTLQNVTSGVTVNANTGAAGTIDVVQTLDATADTINFGISNSTAKTVFKLDASEFETIAITTDDSATTATGIAHTITTLDATVATALTISGDAGLTIGTLTGTALTSINASNVTAGAVTITTGALASASTINGGAGNDVISAASAVGAVTLNGNAGNDYLVGGAAADTINGGTGDDVILGSAGADTLTGGAGRDTFAVLTVTHSNGVNVDTVTDFVSGTDLLSAGNNAITYLGEASSYGTVLTTFTGTAYQAVMDTSTKTVYIDVNGDAALTAADIAITTNVSDLSQTDFAILGTTGADAIALSAAVDTVISMGGADTITSAANTTAIAALGTGNLSIANTGMDIIYAVAGATINLTAPLGTDANYDVVTNAAAGDVITKTVTATTVNQFVGLYDYVTGTFTSTTTTAANSASTTDVAASLFLYATGDATTADEGIILIGSVANATITNGVLTIA